MSRILAAALLALLALPGAATAAGRPAAAEPTTRIDLTVKGCPGCRVQAVQNTAGTLSWTSPQTRVRDGHVVIDVPTARTQKMAFLVTAPFDEYAQAGVPMVAVTAFRVLTPGERVPGALARGTRRGSGCWAGTTAPTMTNTLVVSKVRQVGLDGKGRATVAAGYLRYTLPSLPYRQKLVAASLHSSDPSICR